MSGEENQPQSQACLVDIGANVVVQPGTSVNAQSNLHDYDKGPRQNKSKSKKRKRAKFDYVSSSSSDNEDSDLDLCSSDDDSGSENDKADSAYSHFDPEEKLRDEHLPDNLDSFAKKYFSKYLDPEAMDKVPKDFPVPNSKAFVVPKLDETWRESLEEDRFSGVMLKTDSHLERIHSFLVKTMGPLSHIWTALDPSAKTEPKCGNRSSYS